MHDIGNPLEILKNLQGRFGQKRETKSVVLIFARRLAVKMGTAKKPLVFDEPHRHFVIQQGRLDTDPVFLALSHVNTGLPNGLKAKFLAVNRSIKRQNHADIVAQAHQGFGQGTNDITQAARFGEGRTFGRNKSNFHGNRAILTQSWG